MSVELRRYILGDDVDPQVKSLGVVVNRLIDRDNGSAPGRQWLIGGDDGIRRELLGGAEIDTDNPVFWARSDAGNHGLFEHSNGTDKIAHFTDDGAEIPLITGPTHFDDTVDVDGAATFGSTVHIIGPATLDGALVTKGAVTLGDAAGDVITITGTATFAEDVTMAKGLIVDTTTLVVDETTNRVGIGIAAPQRPLHVVGAAGPLTLPATSGNTIALFENNGNGVVAIISTTSGIARYAFGDTAAPSQGGLLYTHSTDLLEIQAAAATKVSLDATGVGFNGTSPVAPPALTGSAAAAYDATTRALINAIRDCLQGNGLAT